MRANHAKNWKTKRTRARGKLFALFMPPNATATKSPYFIGFFVTSAFFGASVAHGARKSF
jgi:hypothetical protein